MTIFSYRFYQIPRMYGYLGVNMSLIRNLFVRLQLQNYFLVKHFKSHKISNAPVLS